MAFDGMVTRAVAKELSERITLGKIEKIYQPEADELVFNIHTKEGNVKLYMSCASNHARIHLSDENYENPAQPMALCMLLRKHLHGARIQSVSQVGCERIIEINFETMNELGFGVNKKLVIEIMGKHSNIALLDSESGRIIDCLKRVSIDVNRVRQLLPGKVYEYPPAQDKLPFDSVTAQDIFAFTEGDLEIVHSPESYAKVLLSHIGGISPAIAGELAKQALAADGQPAEAVAEALRQMCVSLETPGCGRLYEDAGTPRDFHVIALSDLETSAEVFVSDSISKTIERYFLGKSSTNRIRQKSGDLERAVRAALDKLYLKKQRLSEDLLAAQNSDDYRLYGELITANMHLIRPGARSVKVINYYDCKEIEVPLDERFSGAKNAQVYFKKYGKAKTAIHEKQAQLEETDMDISYLESVVSFAERAASVDETEAIREELMQGGYLKRRNNKFAPKKLKAKPIEYHTSTGYRVLVGKNNTENDILTFKTASSKDIWLHTKDIHGSHVILFAEGKSADELGEQTIYEAASIAAYHSQGRESENVPVDYVPARLVKKPAGAKPGMVIFTGNRTVWVNPGLPGNETIK